MELLDSGVREWVGLLESNPALEVVRRKLKPSLPRQTTWQAARLSKAVYLLRETNSQWSVVAKFYGAKTNTLAERYALREHEQIARAQQLGLAHGPRRAVESLGCWRGTLFLEHVQGPSLLDAIAIRRGQPGHLTHVLEQISLLLLELHTAGSDPDIQPDSAPAVAKARKYVEQLARYGVLQKEPVIHEGLSGALARWAELKVMGTFTPTVLHGDATVSNFLLPREDCVVAIDWEAMVVGDPAFDIGRLGAEVSHSVEQHGGGGDEAAHFVAQLYQHYQRLAAPEIEAAAFTARARFYQAMSSLRIARNGWVPRRDRMALVAQAMALLSTSGT
jgi:thiamine kinase-like enzyme